MTPGFSAVDCHHHGHGGSAAAGSPAMASFASRTSGSASACPRAHQRPTTCGHARVRHLASYLHRRPEVPRESPSHPLAFWLTLLVDRPSTFVQFKSTASRAPATAVLIPPVPTHVICVALRFTSTSRPGRSGHISDSVEVRQPEKPPSFDVNLVGKQLEVCWPYKLNGKTAKIWASGRVVRVADRLTHYKSARCKKPLPAGAVLWAWDADPAYDEQAGVLRSGCSWRQRSGIGMSSTPGATTQAS